LIRLNDKPWAVMLPRHGNQVFDSVIILDTIEMVDNPVLRHWAIFCFPDHAMLGFILSLLFASKVFPHFWHDTVAGIIHLLLMYYNI